MVSFIRNPTITEWNFHKLKEIPRVSSEISNWYPMSAQHEWDFDWKFHVSRVGFSVLWKFQELIVGFIINTLSKSKVCIKSLNSSLIFQENAAKYGEQCHWVFLFGFEILVIVEFLWKFPLISVRVLEIFEISTDFGEISWNFDISTDFLRVLYSF